MFFIYTQKENNNNNKKNTMDTTLLQFININPEINKNELYLGPDHWIENTSKFPSVSAIINESQSKIGLSIAPQYMEKFDKEWKENLHKIFRESQYEEELENYFTTGLSNGRPLKLQVMILPPGMYCRIHAHPNIEFELTLHGTLQEFRWLWRVTPSSDDDGGVLTGDSPSGPEIAKQSPFVHNRVKKGQCMLNETGSVHQSFTEDDGCVILVLWSGCHANIHPSRIYNTDPRLKSCAGWDRMGL